MRLKHSTSIFTLTIIVAALGSYGTPMVDTTTFAFSRLKIDVYYESLCRPSMRFFKNQLIPGYASIKDVLNITLIPYGNAIHTQDPITSQWEFVCQHGADECEGNKAQACGLAEIEKLSLDFQQRQDLAVDFVGCVMSSRYPATAVPQCAVHVNLTEDSRKRINQCKSNAEGDELLVAAGDKTKSVTPRITGIPTVVVNETFNENQQYNLLVDFGESVCELIPEESRPSQCDI